MDYTFKTSDTQGELQLIATDHGKTIGELLFKAEGHVGNLLRIFVTEDHRGQGIGSRLMAELERRAFREGVKEIGLTAPMNTVLFFVSLGYATSGDPFDEKGGRSCAMKRRLDEPVEGNVPHCGGLL